ncbi:hypothetical protein QQ045_026093 [Rhodiola kirilowii]
MSSLEEQICILTEQHLHSQNAEQDDEIGSLVLKESRTAAPDLAQQFPSLAVSRSQAVHWMLKVVQFYTFSSHTAFLAVNYYDRFFSRFGFQEGKSWMTQLAAVACLSLAAKMEETNVPLLVDFQVEEAKYVFEAKTIQKMEILVLSTLDWEMNAATTMSFVDHLTRRYGFIGFDIPSRCEDLLLRALADINFVNFRPSVMAASALLNVIITMCPCILTSTQNQLIHIHKYDKLELDECCSFLQRVSSKYHQNLNHERMFSKSHDSPKGVLDASLNSETSNELWALSPRASSSPEPMSKKTKIHHKHD